MEKVLIVGGGPCGISVAIECKKRGIEPLIIEKGAIANTIYSYPLSMTFFSSADKIEIGDVPFTTVNERPKREEALVYYRTLVQTFGIRVHTHEQVEQIKPLDDGFLVWTKSRVAKRKYHSKYVVVATGYYDQPHLLNIPGEDFAHVHHYFRDAHPYAGQQVVVIGGRHSAIHAALELQRVGTDVTMVYRQGQFDESIKPWIRPLIESAIKNERIKMLWKATVTKIESKQVVVQQQGEEWRIPADAVFAMTGYRPNLELFQQIGAKIDQTHEAPLYTEKMETSIPNLYVAGVVVTGKDPTRVFIENGRFHGKIIAEDIGYKERGTP